jgi:5'(3')-deoxyribonucleotidase
MNGTEIMAKQMDRPWPIKFKKEFLTTNFPFISKESFIKILPFKANV